MTEGQAAVTEEAVREALKQVVDPELGINIVDLGLVYGIGVEGGKVHVRMTLTAIGCPLAFMVNEMVTKSVRDIPGVEDVQVELVWDPPWTPDRMSEEARALLGFW